MAVLLKTTGHQARIRSAYQISLSVSDQLETSAILVSKSTNGGATWGPSTTLIRDTSGINFNDKESITADPTRPGSVYAVWDRGAFPGDQRSITSEFHSFAFRGQPIFSRTTDGGAHWSAPVAMSNSFRFAAQIADCYRRDRTFLIGDAAHRMTPRGGTGMNTGIQDAFDVGWKLAWVLQGWAPAGLLDTYEDERRPIALHNVGRAGSPGGARRTTNEALPWDLDNRIAHCWLDTAGGRVSTIDLIGDGLTLFTAHDDAHWTGPIGQTGFAAPFHMAALPPHTAAALGLEPAGAVLVRPDGHEVARWVAPDTTPRPGTAWLAP